MALATPVYRNSDQIPKKADLCEGALALAAKGARVFPCGPDKKPLISAWTEKATRDKAIIRGWWAKWPDALIALALDGNVFVVDVDNHEGGANGIESLARLQAEHGKIGKTTTAKTRSNGKHLYFRSDGDPIRNTAGKIAPGIDTRGAGGFVIAPPSPGWEWEDPTIAAAAAPQWLLDAIRSKPKVSIPSLPPPTAGKGYGAAALKSECSKVTAAANGTRNHSLNSAAHSLGQLVSGNVLSKAKVIAALEAAAASCGLPEIEAAKTIRSGLKAGMESPRGVPESNQGTVRFIKAEEKPCTHQTLTGTSLLQKHFEALKEVIRGGFRPIGLGITAAKPKAGKSWLELALSWAVSSGLIALGHFETEGGDCLYIALEDSPRRIQSRLRAIIGADFAENNRLHIVFDWRRLDKGGLDDIEAWLKDHPNARMITIDTFAKIKPGKSRDVDQYTADYEATGALQKLALKYGVHICLVMHQRKALAEDIFDSISGTLGLTGAADVIAVLARDRSQKGVGRLHLTGRDIPEKTLELSFSEGIWAFTRELDEVDDKRLGSVDQAIEFLMDILAQGKLPSDEIIKQAKQNGINRNILFQAKERMGVRARKSSFTGPWEWSLPNV